MPQLDIRLLGPPEVELDGEPIQVDTRKAIALLAYLAVTGEHHRRDSLAAFLWPESDQPRARAALRRTLSSLSTALAGDWLEVTRETIGLSRSHEYRLDIDEFRSGIDCARLASGSFVERLNHAVNLYRDDFMAGFALRDSPPFDDWQYLEADALRRELSRALEQLTAASIDAGNWSAAIDYAHRWLNIDLLQESAHRQLMRIYAACGDRASAIRQYRECVQILDRELGVSPLDETTALYQAIMDRQVCLPPPPAHSPSERSTGQPALPGLPLVGRDREYSALLGAYESVDQAGRLVVVEGEAGIGKTRLATELVKDLESNGSAVVTGVCYSGESDLAYGVVASLLRASLEHIGDAHFEAAAPHVRTEISRLIPELARGGALSPLDSPGALDRFYDAIIQHLISLGTPAKPALLFIDDLQWADRASLGVLAYLIRRLHRSPICVLVTWRTEDVPSTHDLRQVLARAQRDAFATVLELAPLSASDLSALAEHAAGDRVEDLSRTLYRESEGIPFFAVEYLAHIDETATSCGDPWPIPGSIRDLIHSRLSAVGDAGRQLLTTAAIIGRSFDFDLLREVSGRSEAEAIETLDRLLARRLIRESPTPGHAAITYDFSHEKIRGLLYDEASLARRRVIHHRTALALERRSRRQGESGSHASLIAQHFRLAGMEREAADYYRRAGDYARNLFGNVEALEHYRTALALGHPDPAILHEAIGDLETLDGFYGDALRSYQAAAAYGEAARLPVIEQKLGSVHHRLGDWEIAERHFEAAFGGFDAGRVEARASVLADWSLAVHQSGDTERALDIGRRALDLALDVADDATLARTYNLLGILARAREEPIETARHLEQSLRFAASMDDPVAKIAALNNLALACADQRRFDRAMQLTEEALELCRSVGDRHREAALLNNLADFHHLAGDDGRSMALLKEAVVIFSEIGQRTDTVRPGIWKLVEW